MERKTRRAVRPTIEATIKGESSQGKSEARRFQVEIKKLKWYCRTTQTCVERGRCNCKTASARLFNALLEAKKGRSVKDNVIHAETRFGQKQSPIIQPEPLVRELKVAAVADISRERVLRRAIVMQPMRQVA